MGSFKVGLVESSGAIRDGEESRMDSWRPDCASEGKVVSVGHDGTKMAMSTAAAVALDLGGVALKEAKKLFKFFISGWVAEARRLLEAGLDFHDGVFLDGRGHGVGGVGRVTNVYR